VEKSITMEEDVEARRGWGMECVTKFENSRRDVRMSSSILTLRVWKELVPDA
jgi:hypothetical protein